MKLGHFAALALVASSAFAGTAEVPSASWRSDVEATFADARASMKPVLVDLYADWCGWCKVLEAQVFSTPEFAEATRGYELLRVDVEDGGAGTELAARYRAGSLPTLLVLEPTGALVGAIVGYHETAAFIGQIRSAFALHQRVVATFEQARSADDLELVSRVAADLYARRDGARAAELYGRLLGRVELAGDEAAWMRYYHADALRLARRFDEARSAARAAAASGVGTTDSELAERLELLPFWIARDERRCGDARELLTGFESRHPRSVLLPGARNAFARLHGAAEVCS
jgi:thioredoxin-like negative regulator of GroEL